MKDWNRKLSWVLVVGVLGIPGAGKAAAQALAINSAVVQSMGPQQGDNGKLFLDIIGRGNTFSSAGPSFSVVEFSSGDLGLSRVSNVDSVTLSLAQSLFGAASRGPLAFYVTDDTHTSIEGDGTSPLVFDPSDPQGLNGQLANLYLLGEVKFRLVRNGHIDHYTFSITDPTLNSYLVSQINAGRTLRFVIAPDANAAGKELSGGAFTGYANMNTNIVPMLSAVAQ